MIKSLRRRGPGFRSGFIRRLVAIIAFLLMAWEPLLAEQAHDSAPQFLEKSLEQAPPLNTNAGPIWPEGDISWSSVTMTVQQMIVALNVPGAYLMVARADDMLYEKGFGGYASDTQLNVASASKWVTSAVLMSLVEAGQLKVDSRWSELEAGLTEDKAGITLAQMLSHTSGMAGITTDPIDLQLPVDITLGEAAHRIALVPLEYPPSTTFNYGGAAFQVAGALAEKAAGKSWEQIFQQRIALPLGMQNSYYTHPLPQMNGRVGMTNPNLQGGLQTTPADYWKFLTMIADKGRIGSSRVFDEKTIAKMEQTRLGTVTKKVPLPGVNPEFEYGLGLWCEVVEVDGQCSVVSSPGAWGTYPWIDRRSDVRGLLVVKNRLPNVRPWIDQVRRLISEIDIETR